MYEQEPQEQLFQPYQIPTSNQAKRQIETLEIKELERYQLEARLSELDNESNELRVRLGREAIESFRPYHRTPEYLEAIKQQEEDYKDRSIKLLEGIDLPSDVPIMIEREEFVDLDLAGGYYIYTNFTVQQSEDVLFIEKNVRSTHQRASGPTTSQYIISKNLASPLVISGLTENLLPRIFMLDLAGLDSWFNIHSTLLEVSEELETEKLRNETLGILEDCPLVRGRWPGNSARYKIIPVNEGQQIQVQASYFQDEGMNILDELVIFDVIDNETQESNRLRPRQGEFSSYKKGGLSSNPSPRAGYKKALGVVKALLAHES